MTETRAAQPGERSSAYDPLPPRYRRQWVVAWILAGLLAGMVTWRYLRPPVPPPPVPDAVCHALADWFQIVVLPELNSDAATAAGMLTQMGEWIKALRENGFVLLSFTQVISRLERREGVPERTVVLVFEPGYRLTYEGVAPLLADVNVAALWVTEDPGIYSTDRRFVTRHQRWRMGRSGRWDVALRNPNTDGFVLHPSGVVPLGERRFDWSLVPDRSGINRMSGQADLGRVHANRNLTAQELVDRLLAEHPIDRPRQLTAHEIMGRAWGSVPAPADSRPIQFDLVANSDQRAATVSWLGSAGLADLELDLSVSELHGELWVLLRSDRASRRRIRVGFTSDRLLVHVEDGDHHHEFATRDMTRTAGDSLACTIRLKGSQLCISMAECQDLIVNGISLAASDKSLLEINARSRIRGVARATGIEMSIIPGGSDMANVTGD